MAGNLLNEVSPLLPYYHILQSAEQNYYGDKTVLTTPITDYHSSKLSGNATHKKKGSKSENLQEKLKAGFQAIKNVVQDALSLDDHHDEPTSSGQIKKLQEEVSAIKLENQQLRNDIEEIRKILNKMNCSDNTTTKQSEASNKLSNLKEKDDDDNFDLFDSDEEEKESEEHKRIREERLAAYAAKKATKPALIAKSSVLLELKPWDDETDLKELEKLVRGIELDGLLWGAAKLVPVGYGINNLHIVTTVEDDKISVEDDLIERIQDEFSDYVQSVDIVSFNKI